MWEYILLGILQGIFEWVPISSQGVLVIANYLLGLSSNPIEIALFLHLGTLFAVFIFFWKDWLEILSFRDIKLIKFLIITSTISLLIGFMLFQFLIDIVIGSLFFFLMGIGLIFTAFFNKKKRRTGKERKGKGFIVSVPIMLLTGILQGLAVIPGISRSGATIFGLSFTKYSPTQVLKISYLMSAPIIVVSSAYIFIRNPTMIEGWPALIVSFIVGMVSLKYIMKISQRLNFPIFTIIMGFLCIISAILTFFL